MDFIVKLPISRTYDTILTITDTFSKASILIPCNETIDATGVAQLYTNYVLPHYGLPLRIILDRDCHGSAGTPLGTHAIGQDSGLEESRKTIRT
jgi:hypothetical protein